MEALKDHAHFRSTLGQQAVFASAASPIAPKPTLLEEVSGHHHQPGRKLWSPT